MKNTYKLKKSSHQFTRKRRNKYTENDFNSNYGMMTSVWGPCAWFFIHTISFNFPTQPTLLDKKNYRNFILNLQHVLPCKYCRINLKENIRKLPITLSVMKNRDSFSKYIYDLHNLVNKRLDKPICMSYEEVRDFYENFRARCSKNKVKEKGCTEALFGKKKAKCILKFVPKTKKCKNMVIEE